MVKLTFTFNTAKLQKNGLTADDMLTEIREYARQHDISEISYGVLAKDGDDTEEIFGKIITEMVFETDGYLDYLDGLELDVDGEKEDALAEMKKWLQQKGNTIQMKLPFHLVMKIKEHHIPFKIDFGFDDTAVITLDRKYIRQVKKAISN